MDEKIVFNIINLFQLNWAIFNQIQPFDLLINIKVIFLDLLIKFKKKLSILIKNGHHPLFGIQFYCRISNWTEIDV